jgi:hypothetical protein
MRKKEEKEFLRENNKKEFVISIKYFVSTLMDLIRFFNAFCFFS